ncbi:2-keto-3-deoxygluconate permease [Helcococcus ovis]|uniref:2-keto-3-deoxygluconate permease n=1 Tax=Helcococcus ovis TaxID=72026 RepID=UPI003916E38F
MIFAAIINTVYPTLFHIGGVTEALLSGNSLEFVLGATIFISGSSLKLNNITIVVKRYGVLLIFRTIICVLLSLLFYKIFGLDVFLGISLIAFIVTLTSINPALFLAIMNDCGDDIDKSSFAFVSLFATPVIPMLIFGLTQPINIDFMPLVSMVVPLVLGVIIGNLDADLGKFLSSGMPFIIFLLGWAVGSKLNLIEAVRAGLSGILMAGLYYIFTTIPVVFVEKKLLKGKGLSSIGVSTIAGISASIPIIMAKNNPLMLKYSTKAAAIVSLGGVITAIISPYLSKRLVKKA